MSELSSSENHPDNQEPSTSLFGYELIRDVLLPELLGKDAPEILYWAGKRLARKFPLGTMEEIKHFFINAEWGHLNIKEEKRSEMVLELTGEIISARLKNNSNLSFQLEAGFLAQQLESQKKLAAETFEHPTKRSGKIQFTVKWDKSDILNVSK
ncbi:YslB family protein [Mesobacillus foraminis]|uniref:YslB family protein n=1 Tax=Mesobacillus foraminis TaxID=279826 RepID=UPI000EF50C50|nr:YslB family protein [Mesobacillus foraminis]